MRTDSASVFILAPRMVDTPGFRGSLSKMPRRMSLTPHEFAHLGANAGIESSLSYVCSTAEEASVE